MTFDNKKYWE